jgi:hypothetical protein
MRFFFNALLAAATLYVAGAHAQGVTNKDLLERCSTKTIVFNSKGDVVARDLDGYCRGYLESAYQALDVYLEGRCTFRRPITPQYLLSLYETFLEGSIIPLSEYAAKSLRSAFIRGFDCNK